MIFSTLTFFVFLGLVWSGYWLIGHRRAQNVLLILASYAFYSWWDYRFCALMLFSTAVDYAAGIGLARTSRPAGRRAWLGMSIAVNLGMLGFFKYFNFFAESLCEAAALMGVAVDPITLLVVLPVGISFYTFQTLGYTIDVYRGRVRPCRDAVDYLAYVSFFPQLVAGPIERAANLLDQFASPRNLTRKHAVDGCRQILWGLTKKMLVADNLAPIVERIYDDPAGTSGPMLLFGTVCFAFQIYCDFSGYTDIALGTARLFGIELMRNFAYPYFSRNVGEFWRRWHISLSTWFRDYVYIPLGGSHASRRRRSFNVMVTFCLSGLWHGASWNFVAWGALNGAAVLPGVWRRAGVVRRAADTPGGEPDIPRLRTLVSMVATFSFIGLTWVFFRAKTLGDAGTTIGKIVGDALDGAAWLALGQQIIDDRSWLKTVLLLSGLVSIEWVQRRHPHVLARLPRHRAVRWAIYTVLIWSVLFWGTQISTQFIYFQF